MQRTKYEFFSAILNVFNANLHGNDDVVVLSFLQMLDDVG